MWKLKSLVVLSLVIASGAGCALMHELQPHRLKKWNSGPAPSFDPEFGALERRSSEGTVLANADAVLRAQNAE